VLGRGLGQVATGANPRHEELTRAMFDRLGWRRDDFIGYRAEVEYPLWGGAYFAVFTW